MDASDSSQPQPPPCAAGPLSAGVGVREAHGAWRAVCVRIATGTPVSQLPKRGQELAARVLAQARAELWPGDASAPALVFALDSSRYDAPTVAIGKRWAVAPESALLGCADLAAAASSSAAGYIGIMRSNSVRSFGTTNQVVALVALGRATALAPLVRDAGAVHAFAVPYTSLCTPVASSAGPAPPLQRRTVMPPLVRARAEPAFNPLEDRVTTLVPSTPDLTAGVPSGAVFDPRCLGTAVDTCMEVLWNVGTVHPRWGLGLPQPQRLGHVCGADKVLRACGCSADVATREALYTGALHTIAGAMATRSEGPALKTWLRRHNDVARRRATPSARRKANREYLHKRVRALRVAEAHKGGGGLLEPACRAWRDDVYKSVCDGMERLATARCGV